MNKNIEDVKKEKAIAIEKIDNGKPTDVRKMRAAIPKTSVLRVREAPTPNARIIRDLIDGDIIYVDYSYKSVDWVKIKGNEEYVLKIWLKEY